MLTVTRDQLLGFLTTPINQRVSFYDHRNIRHDGVVLSVQRESGDGVSFNVVMLKDGYKHEFFVRCQK